MILHMVAIYEMPSGSWQSRVSRAFLPEPDHHGDFQTGSLAHSTECLYRDLRYAGEAGPHTRSHTFWKIIS